MYKILKSCHESTLYVICIYTNTMNHENQKFQKNFMRNLFIYVYNVKSCQYSLIIKQL